MAEGGDTLQPDPIVEALRQISAPPNATVLVGYVGEQVGDAVRIYLDLTLRQFVDIPVSQIVGNFRLPNNQGTILWVEYGTEVTVSRRVQAAFLSGRDFDGLAD